MRNDHLLVIKLLEGYNAKFRTSYRVDAWPEEIEREHPAVEAVARDNRGRSLAIEHTLIQPFVGEKNDTQRFKAAVGLIEADHSIRVPGKSIDVIVPIGVIPRGHDWKLVGTKVAAWFRTARLSLPDGESSHNIPDLGFNLPLRTFKDDSPYPEGRVYVSRSHMPDDFELVLRKAVEDKLPKLVATHADKRILLFEKDNLPRGYVEVGKTVESLANEFADIQKVDEVWVVNTVAWSSEGPLFFYCVWPGGVTAKLRVNGL